MVEFVSDSTNTSTDEDLIRASKLKKSKEPLDSLDSKADYYTFVDSFLDYEAIKDWIEELTSPVMTDAETVVEADGTRVDSTVEGHSNDQNAPASDPTVERSVPIVGKVEPIVLESESAVVQAKGATCDESRDFNCIIEEGMSKVSLVSGSGCLVVNGGNTVKSELECREDDSESDVEYEGTNSASTSSSSRGSKAEEANSSSSSGGNSSCDDEEENEFTVDLERDGDIGDLEEGEIRDVDVAEMTDGPDHDDEDEEVSAERMVAWNDDSDEDDEEAGVKGEPICSKNELKVLPQVPRVHAALQPHHRMLPVGVVLSIIGNQVIVEGVEKHNPLSEGSVLWITDSKSPLGFIDEIFGPVKNPYYSVRYNSEIEVPTGICGGTHISFVSEFADHVLNNKDLYKKGYDASGVNDEEVSDEEEFSDDEKELEFKRTQRLAKRAMNDQKNGNRRKKNSPQARKFGQPTSQHAKMPGAGKYGQPTSRKMPEAKEHGQPTSERAKMPKPGKLDQPTSQQAKMDMVQPSSNQNQHTIPPLAPFVNHSGCPDSSAAGQCFISGTGVIPSFPPTYNPCFNPTLNGNWPTELPFHQQQNPFFPNALPMNGMPWLLHNHPAQQSPQMPMLNTFTGLPYPQGLISTSSPGLGNHLTSAGEQGIHSSGLQFGHNQNLRPPLPLPGVEATQRFNPGNWHPPLEFPGNVVAAQQFNPGASSGQGRKSSRGGAHFRGRRGWRQTR